MPSRVGETRILRTKAGEKIVKFSEDVAQARARAAKLLDPPLGEASSSIDDVLTELRMQNEALLLADEELRAQCEELVRSQRRLEVDRRRYRDLFDLSPDALIVTDRHGTIQEANAHACALIGVEARLVRSKPLTLFIASDDRKAFSAALQSLGTGAKVDLEVAIIKRGGGTALVTMQGTRMNDPLFSVWTARERSLSTLSSGARDPRDESLRRLQREFDALTTSTREWTRKLREPDLSPQERDEAIAAVDRNQAVNAKLIVKMADLYFSLIKPPPPAPPPSPAVCVSDGAGSHSDDGVVEKLIQSPGVCASGDIRVGKSVAAEGPVAEE